jgi:multimeric flavodoxin WrbA
MKKILLINSSSHQNGCTWRALKEVQDQLAKNGVESDLIWLETRQSRTALPVVIAERRENVSLKTK